MSRIHQEGSHAVTFNLDKSKLSAQGQSSIIGHLTQVPTRQQKTKIPFLYERSLPNYIHKQDTFHFLLDFKF